MAIQKEEVSIDVQDITELLHSGYTWFKKDDLGYGSIQEKFNALDTHIRSIQKHPDLQNVDTIARVFIITNKGKQKNGTTTISSVDTRDEQSLESLPLVEEEHQESNPFDEVSNGSKVGTAEEELSAFANL